MPYCLAGDFPVVSGAGTAVQAAVFGQRALLFVVEAATPDGQGGYTCNVGSYLALTPGENKALITSTVEAMDRKIKVEASPASAEQYDAVNALFGLFLVALVLIWSKKKILQLLTGRPES